MKEKLRDLIEELEATNAKFSEQIASKPDMIWTYKSAKLNEISVNKTLVVKLNKIIDEA